MPTQGAVTQQGELFDLADFTITIPDDMVALDVTSKMLDEATANGAMSGLSPEILRNVKQALEGGLIKLMAFDISAGDPEFADNMNVVIERLPVAMSQEAVVKANLLQLRSAGFQLMAQDRFATGQHEFDRLQCSIPAAGVEFYSYILARGSTAYTVTFTSKPERTASFRLKGETIMRSFRPK
ncbi:MAG: hypothetical protein GC172_03130 [Phycisphaera sp.]|nr:hypothetical protein [Phycisphaera sp.]